MSGGTEGFTLIELILVVGIIGVLASVVLPNFRNFQARTRQSEAKIILASAFTTQNAYFNEQESYTTCLSATLFGRQGNKLYYGVGFSTSASTCGAGGVDCHTERFEMAGPVPCAAGLFPAGGFFPATVSTGAGAPVDFATFTGAVATTINKDNFVLSAVGRVSDRPGAALDVWTINQTKVLVNTQSGL